MPNTEQLIVACASCETQYNVSSMAPGAKFKCKKCGTINIVPAAEESVQEQPPPPPPPPRPQAKPQVKSVAKQTAPPPRTPISRIAPAKTSAPLKKGFSPKSRPSLNVTTKDDGENIEISSKKTGALGGLLSKQNRKYLFIAGPIVLVLLATLYVMNSRNVYEKNKRISAKAADVIKEINGLISTKDFVKASEKGEAFVKEFNGYNIAEVQKNVEKTKTSLKGIEKLIEQEKEGRIKLTALLDKKKNTSLDQYPDLEKEFNKFIIKYSEIGTLVNKAYEESKDIQAKIAAKQEEEDTKVFSELIVEIKPMVDGGKIDEAIARLKKYWDDNKMSPRLQSAIKKKLSELKSMK